MSANALAVRVTWFDRALMSIAPAWGLRRVRARAAAALMVRHYEAAASGHRTFGWHRSSADPNVTNAAALPALRELSRDLRRNNGWARRGIQAIVNNTVGWGIQPKAIAKNPDVAGRALETWNAWANSSAGDFDGRMPFYGGLQRLVMDTIVESGEALVTREVAKSSDGLAVPVRIRVLEADCLDTARDGVTATPGGNPIVHGIEFDGRGRRVAYYILDNGPRTRPEQQASFASRRVAAADVLHIYHVARPGQVRGVPWLAAAIAKLQDFDDYEDALLMQQKIAACFGAFVQDYDGASTPIGEPHAADDRLETLEPGRIEYLPPGKSISFATPPSTSNHGPFTVNNLRRVAAALGVTYEDLTGDYSNVNFSSARMARLSHWANVHDWQWNMIIPQLCDGVWSWVTGMAAQLDGWPETPRAEWSTPPMPMLDPDKEGLAYQRMVRGGSMTLFEMIRERGYDPLPYLKEIADGNRTLDELGIWLDSDPRRTSAAGLTQAPGSEPPGAPTQEEAA